MSRYIPFIFAFSLFVFSVCGVETGAAESVKLCQSYELWEEWDTLKSSDTEKYERLKAEHDRTARTVELPPEETKVESAPPQRTIVEKAKEHYVNVGFDRFRLEITGVIIGGLFLLLLFVWWFISRIWKAAQIKQEEEKERQRKEREKQDAEQKRQAKEKAEWTRQQEEQKKKETEKQRRQHWQAPLFILDELSLLVSESLPFNNFDEQEKHYEALQRFHEYLMYLRCEVEVGNIRDVADVNERILQRIAGLIGVEWRSDSRQRWKDKFAGHPIAMKLEQ
jgi:Na+-transporting methylmalonyl-CoA/oxaloacetate decarboxylase gamma subunit